ncbi:DUF1642 domain-containing protein [Lacticaseibacillus paracasei]|uniref:DUF1642 domain-containing protein n=1 Tax=Lacticaseibacillus paracasei TaxID=1597 RepID=UPI0028E09B02|nr:DUF1642 domain-containing protein [Lacticaseibacillus paracasei]MDT8951294.1 DUF1642 domain-containing protein [Lacticaseibacillus paracasei subsp. paracasei]
MSEEKLYAVKNDEGKYWDFEDQDGFWELNTVTLATVAGEEGAKCVAHDHGGHVVTFVEEPKKVVLTKEQAEIVEKARVSDIPATYISARTDEYNGEERLLMNAYVNGYTVAKEKKYLVYKELGGKQKNKHEQVAQAYRSNLFFDTIIWLIKEHKIMSSDASDQFTEAGIEHYGLQDCEKEEVTDDGE